MLPKPPIGVRRAFVKRSVSQRLVWMGVAAILLVPAMTYGLSRLAPSTTTATVRLRLLSGAMDAFISPKPIDPAYLRHDAQAVRALPAAMDAVRLLPSPPATPAAFTRRARELAQGIRVAVDPRNGTLSITARDRSPQRAGLIADAFAQALLALRRAQSVSIIRGAVAALAVQARAAPPRLRSSLDTRIVALRVVLAGEGQQTEVVLPSSSSSSAVTNALIALVLSALICAGLLGAQRARRRPGPDGGGSEPVNGPGNSAPRPVEELVSPAP